MGQLRSPPPSPPAHSGPASPAGSCGAGEAVPCEPHLEHSQQSPPYSTSGVADSPGATPQQASPAPDKENQGSNWSPGDTSKRQQAGHKAAQWDEERLELLNLLERLQDQLSAHAELAASARKSSRPPQRQHAAPPPSPFCQRHFAEQEVEDGETAASAVVDEAAEAGEAAEGGAMPCGSGEPTAFSPATAQRSNRAAGNLQASFDSVGGSSTASEEPSSEEVGAEGGSPAVAAHPVFDSPLPPESVARSGAPSPPSVRPPQSEIAGAQQQGEEQTPSSRPAAAPASLEEAVEQEGQPIPRARSSAGASQTLEAFLSPPAGSSPVAYGAPPGSANLPATAEQQRLLQAEQRAAELEVGRLRVLQLRRCVEA